MSICHFSRKAKNQLHARCRRQVPCKASLQATIPFFTVGLCVSGPRQSGGLGAAYVGRTRSLPRKRLGVVVELAAVVLDREGVSDRGLTARDPGLIGDGWAGLGIIALWRNSQKKTTKNNEILSWLAVPAPQHHPRSPLCRLRCQRTG